MLVAQRPIGVDRDLGAGQVRGRPLDLEHAGQVPVVGDVAAQAAGRGERQGGGAIPGGELDQFGGVRAGPAARTRAAGALARQAAGSRPPVYRPTRPEAPPQPLVLTTA